jgi:hypothetical protein
VNGLVVLIALYRRQDGLRKSGKDVFDFRILHDVLFGGPECLFVLLIEKGGMDLSTKKRPTLLVGLYPWVVFLVITNELHLDE